MDILEGGSTKHRYHCLQVFWQYFAIDVVCSLWRQHHYEERASGKRGSVFCTTFLPAIDSGELRTILLIGALGTQNSDEPVEVEIVGNLYDHKKESNFKGQKVRVTPLSAGPFLVRAEIPPKREWKIGQQSQRGARGSGCPKGTEQALRVVWAGGITKPGGAPADEKEGRLYQVTMISLNGETKVHTPFALGDLGDGDNNHLLCLSEKGTPQSVFFPKGHLTDPNEDATNPDTTVRVTLK